MMSAVATCKRSSQPGLLTAHWLSYLSHRRNLGNLSKLQESEQVIKGKQKVKVQNVDVKPLLAVKPQQSIGLLSVTITRTGLQNQTYLFHFYPSFI